VKGFLVEDPLKSSPSPLPPQHKPVPMAWINPGRSSPSKDRLVREKHRKERVKYRIEEALRLREMQSQVQSGQSAQGGESLARQNSSLQPSPVSNARDSELERRQKFLEEQAKTNREVERKKEAFRKKIARPRDTRRGSRHGNLNERLARSVRNRRV